MTENKYATIIKTIAFVSMFCGIIGSIILSFQLNNWYILIIGSVVSIIEGVFCLGFSEIIILLQSNYDKQSQIYNKQSEILESINNLIRINVSKNSKSSDFVDKNDSIISNSVHKKQPDYLIKNSQTLVTATKSNKDVHSWRCTNCNNMISELPCPYCGDRFN